jgi:hypothetical protein
MHGGPAGFRRFGVEWLTGLVDAIGADQVDIVGSSMGGYLGRAFALAQPERVRRLVQIGVGVRPGTWVATDLGPGRTRRRPSRTRPPRQGMGRGGVAGWRVVSGGGDRRAVVWDVTTRKEIAQISCPVYELAIGPLRTGESTLVIAYESSEFSLWQSSMNHRTNCLCIQPDGSWVIRAEWGKILGVFPAHSGGSGCRLRTAGASAGDPAARTAHETAVADIRVSSGEESTPQHPRHIAVSAHGPSRMRQGQKAVTRALAPTGASYRM